LGRIKKSIRSTDNAGKYTGVRSWLFWAIDVLASEYGWAKDDILNTVYFDELFYLQKEIKARRIAHYRMLTAIYQSTLTGPKAVWDMLEEMEGEEDSPSQVTSPEFDSTGFDMLQLKIKGAGSRIAIKT
jgi:hypothetical protein